MKSTFVIKDLTTPKELTSTEMSAIVGGFTNSTQSMSLSDVTKTIKDLTIPICFPVPIKGSPIPK